MFFGNFAIQSLLLAQRYAFLGVQKLAFAILPREVNIRPEGFSRKPEPAGHVGPNTRRTWVVEGISDEGKLTNEKQYMLMTRAVIQCSGPGPAGVEGGSTCVEVGSTVHWHQMAGDRRGDGCSFSYLYCKLGVTCFSGLITRPRTIWGFTADIRTWPVARTVYIGVGVYDIASDGNSEEMFCSTY